MTKDEFLTVRWNNRLALGFGIPTAVYVVVAFASTAWWLRQNAPEYEPVKQGFAHPASLVRFAYNAAFWVFLIPFFSGLGYGAGFMAFAAVLLLRFASNWYTNNALDLGPEQYDAHPFRIP